MKLSEDTKIILMGLLNDEVKKLQRKIKLPSIRPGGNLYQRISKELTRFERARQWVNAQEVEK